MNNKIINTDEQYDEQTIEINKTNKNNFGSFTKEQWNSIEILETNQHTLNVYKVLANLGEGLNANIIQNLNCTSCGDILYVQIIRKILEKINYVETVIPDYLTNNLKDSNNTNITQNKNDKHNKSKNKQSKNKQSKKEQILEDSKKQKLKLLMEDFIKTTIGNKQLNRNGFCSQIIEIRFATFIHHANILLKNPQYKSNYYELIVGIEKTLKNIGSLECSTIAKYDLIYNVNKLKKHCKFDVFTLLNLYPKLVLSTDYDDVFPTMSIKPYASQVNLMENIRNTESALFLYKAMIGSGKTSFVISLCKYIKSLKITNGSTISNSTTQIVFVCSVDTVRLQIAKIAYNVGIAFGIASITDKGLKISNNNLYCKDPTKRILIIADLVSAVEILKESQNYILFLDEPTIGADQQYNSITMEVMKIILLAPSKTILSSATLPSELELEPIVHKFKERHHMADIITVVSKEIFIGCEIENLDNNNVLLPHDNCKSEKELRYIIDKIKNSMFVNRLYTGPILYRIIDRMTKYGLQCINLNDHFTDISLLSQMEIQNIIVSQLEILADTCNDDLIQKICEPLVHDTKNTIEMNSSLWEDDNEIQNEEQTHYSKFKNLLTSDAYKYMGSTLITVKNPIEFANYIHNALFKDCKSATKLIKQYTVDVEKYECDMKKLEKIEDKEYRFNELCKLNESKPCLKFPQHLVINTPAHIAEFCKSKINDNKLIRFSELSQYPLDLNIPDWIYQLLFAGVGIYMPTKLPKNYTTFVLGLATETKLAFMISDYDISYGANYPFSHVIITDDGANDHSINTIFQLLGRAGRVGTSWVAHGHLETSTINRIVKYINDPNINNTDEGKNMNLALEKLIDDLKQKSIKINIHGIEKDAKVVNISNITKINPPSKEARTFAPKREKIQKDNKFDNYDRNKHFSTQSTVNSNDKSHNNSSEYNNNRTSINNNNRSSENNNDKSSRYNNDRPYRYNNNRSSENNNDRPSRYNNRSFENNNNRSSENNHDRPPRYNNRSFENNNNRSSENNHDRPSRYNNNRSSENNHDRPPRYNNNRSSENNHDRSSRYNNNGSSENNHDRPYRSYSNRSYGNSNSDKKNNTNDTNNTNRWGSFSRN
jgi:hypothetical protein